MLCYDSDNAGFKAAEKAFQILAPTGLIVKVAALPAGEDPDSLIRKQGPTAFGDLLKASRDFIDYQVEVVGTRRNMDEMRERVRFAEEMSINIQLLESPVARETAAQRVALRLGIPEDTMRKLIARTQPKAGKEKAVRPQSNHPGKKLLISPDRDAEVLHWLRSQPQDDVLRDLTGTELLTLIWHGQFDPLDPVGINVFLTGLDPEEEAALTQILHQSSAAGGGLASAKHALSALEISRMQMQKQRLQTQLKHPAISPEDAAEIQREIMALHKEIQLAQQQILKPPTS